MKKITLSIVLALLVTSMFATSYTWNGVSGASWNLASNWLPNTGYPSSVSDDVTISSASPVSIALGGATTVNSISFSGGSTVGFTGAFQLTTNSMTITSSQVSFVNNIIINNSLSFSGTNPRLTLTAGTAGKYLLLGNGGAFTLSGNSTTSYIDGNNNADFRFNTTSPLTVCFNPAATTSYYGLTPILGLITLGTSVKATRITFGTTILSDNTQSLILNGNTLTVNATAGTNSFNTTVGSGIDASVTGSKVVILSAAVTSFLSASGRIFKSGTTIDNLEINSTANTFTTGFPLTVNNLTLTAGILGNITNNITIANGGSITRTAGTLAAPPVYGTSVNINIAATCTSDNELLGTTGGIGTLTISGTSVYTYNPTSNVTLNTGLLLSGTGTGALTISSGKTLIMANGSTITRSAVNTLVNNGNGIKYGTQVSDKVNLTYGATLTPSIEATGSTGGIGTLTVNDGKTLTLVAGNTLIADNLVVGNGASGILYYPDSSTPTTLTVNKDITINSGAKLSCGTQTNPVTHLLNVGGNISNSGTFTMVTAAGSKMVDVTLNGTANQNLCAATFNNLTINNSSGANPGLTLTGIITVNNTLTLGNGSTGTINMGGTYSITTNQLTINNWQASFVDHVTINSGLTFSGANSRLTLTAGSAGRYLALGNGGSFSLSGNSTTNYIDGNTNTEFKFNTTNPFTVYFNPAASTTYYALTPTQGLITLGTSVKTQRFSFGANATNLTQGLILNGNTLTINAVSGASYTYNTTSNCSAIDASASGSKVVIYNTGASTATFLNYGSGGNIFKSGATIDNLEINSTGNTFISGFPLTVNNLTLTAGAINNSTNNISLTNGGTISIKAGTLSAAPVFVGSTNLTYNGTSAQTTSYELPSLSSVLSALTINNANGVTLSANATVSGVLTLTAGKITTGSNVLTIGAPGSVSGGSASSYIYGNLKKLIAASTNPSMSFEIGDATRYAPVNLALVGTISNSTGSIHASTASGDHAQIASSGINASKSVNRTWTISNPDAITGLTSYSPTFNFVSGDVDGIANTANFAVKEYSSSAWTSPTVGTQTSTSTQATGVSTFGDFAKGEVATSTITGAATAIAFTTTYGTASAPQSFSISGANLAGSITATAPTGFEVSSDGTSYGPTATYARSLVDFTASGTVYIRLKATATVSGTYNSKNIVLSTSGATSVDISTSASGNAVTAKALTINADNVTKTYGTLLTGGAGSTSFTSSGLVGTETIGSVTIAYGTGAAANAAVTTYSASAVVPSAATGGTFTASNYAITYTDGNIIVGTKVLTITADNQSVVYGTAASTVTGAGTFTPTGFVNSETASVISGSVTYSTIYNNTTVAGTSSVTITPIVTSLTATNYSFTAADGTITIYTQNAVPVTSAQNLGDLTVNAGTDLTVSSNGTLTVNASPKVNSVTVDAGGKVEVTTSNQLIVNNLILNAGYSGNLYDGFSTSSVKVGGSGIKVNGRLRYVRTFDDTQWYFVSFPYDVTVGEITSTAFPFVLGTNWFIKYYDGAQRATGTTSGNWKHITDAPLLADQTTLHAKRGYIIGIASGTMSLTFPMISNTTIAAEADKTIDVTYYGSANAGVAESHKGWNLIGQPFLSKFNAGSSLATNLPYFVFSDGGDVKTYTAKLPSEISNLNPFVSYFVQVDATIAADKASFATNGRQLARSLVETELSDRVRIYFNTTTGSDNTNLLMDNNQTTAYQIGQDLEKWIGTGTAKPQIYTTLGGLNYAYNGLPMSSVVNLPLGVYTQTAGTTTIQADASLAPSLSKLLLTDNGTSPATVTDLLVSNYTFTAAAGTNNTRFAITAQRVTTDNNVIGNEKGDICISIVNGGLVLANVANNASVRVFDALGRMVVSKTATSNMMEIKLNARGIYTVQLQSGSSISTRKVIF
ncbi:MAG: MBG domain-containing protein [Paludibacter sp.]